MNELKYEEFIKLWNELDKAMFSQLPPNHSISSQLKESLLKLFCVRASEQGKMDVIESIFKDNKVLMGMNSNWTPWFSLPYVENPKEHPFFQVYFGVSWSGSVSTTLSNFISSTLSAASRPPLLSALDELSSFQSSKGPGSSSMPGSRTMSPSVASRAGLNLNGPSVWNTLHTGRALTGPVGTSGSQKSGSRLRVALSKDGSRGALSSSNGFIRIATLSSAGMIDGAPVWLESGPTGLVWLDKDRLVAVGTAHHGVSVWDDGTGQMVADWSAPNKACSVVRTLDATVDGRVVMIGTSSAGMDSGEILEWSPAVNGTVGTQTVVGGEAPLCLSLSPGGRSVAFGTAGGSAVVVDRRSDSSMTTLEVAQGSGVVAMDWSEDGTKLVALDGSGTVSLWETAAPSQPVHTVSLGSAATVDNGDVRLSGDGGSALVSVGAAAPARLVNLAEGSKMELTPAAGGLDWRRDVGGLALIAGTSESSPAFLDTWSVVSTWSE